MIDIDLTPELLEREKAFGSDIMIAGNDTELKSLLNELAEREAPPTNAEVRALRAHGLTVLVFDKLTLNRSDEAIEQILRSTERTILPPEKPLPRHPDTNRKRGKNWAPNNFPGSTRNGRPAPR